MPLQRLAIWLQELIDGDQAMIVADNKTLVVQGLKDRDRRTAVVRELLLDEPKRLRLGCKLFDIREQDFRVRSRRGGHKPRIREDAADVNGASVAGKKSRSGLRQLLKIATGKQPIAQSSIFSSRQQNTLLEVKLIDARANRNR